MNRNIDVALRRIDADGVDLVICNVVEIRFQLSTPVSEFSVFVFAHHSILRAQSIYSMHIPLGAARPRLVDYAVRRGVHEYSNSRFWMRRMLP